MCLDSYVLYTSSIAWNLTGETCTIRSKEVEMRILGLARIKKKPIRILSSLVLVSPVLLWLVPLASIYGPIRIFSSFVLLVPLTGGARRAAPWSVVDLPKLDGLAARTGTGPAVNEFNGPSVNGSEKRRPRTTSLLHGPIMIHPRVNRELGGPMHGTGELRPVSRDGRRVRVIERDLSEPNRIVGEVLHPGGYLKLKELGLQDCVENIDAQRMVGYAVFKDGKSVKLPYPLEKFDMPPGRSFHNGRFITKMRHKADSLSNVQLTQGSVTSLLEENGTIKGVNYKSKDGKEIKAYAPLTIVCDGCFSNLRRYLCNPKVETMSSFVGLELKHCHLPFPSHGHVIMADPSPILFYSISSNEIRCLVDIPGPKLPSLANGDMAEYLKTVIAPQVPPELHDAFISAINKGKVRAMRNRSMPAAPCPKPGALLIGDAFNMRHALTGGGMTMALSDIVVLRNLLRNFTDLKDTHLLCKHLESFYTLRKVKLDYRSL
ncbi:Squalene epoxidase 3 [Orobanche gracilis]